ncbi:J domain-containing protein [Paraliomyxa miuraensis]|uniref:J domain-containing protein n=1 Tax=Paraliomyxa miuraensis TaxID=376150 RepID=UPI0022535CBE|nr:J domain-containing protein [Paraliomyxa miuraensis]MCX4248007.1 J domain-containing protein [Paraliomyxa miuraensis]
MSIGKRLIDLARSNLTDFRSAFDRDHLRDLLTSRRGPEVEDEQAPSAEVEDDQSVGFKAGRQARKIRDAAEDAWERAYESAKARAGVRGEPPSDPAADRRRWYKTLELQPGADLKAVRRAYRKAMLQYHPDKFANDPEKQKAATEVTRRLTEAYNGLTRYLGG